MQVVPRLAVEPMQRDDIPAVQAIEREIFPSPWPRNAYLSEITQNRHAAYIVLRQDTQVVGYAGLWHIVNEAHVTTIGVDRSAQGKGFGKALFAALVMRACTQGALWMTLEVRSTNLPAILLYESFGFSAMGRRRGYYTDNGEDAVVMWSDLLTAPRFHRSLEARLEGIDITGVGA